MRSQVGAVSCGCNAAQIQTQASLLLLSWSQIHLLLLGKDPRNPSTPVLLGASCVGEVWFAFFSCVLVQTLNCESCNVFVERYVVCKTWCTF